MVSQPLLLQPPQEVHRDLQESLSAALKLLFLLLPQTLWVIAAQTYLHHLQLVLHKGEDVLLQQLQKKERRLKSRSKLMEPEPDLLVFGP